MPEQTPQRRLAAILAADVVGYSRLMGVSEAGTLAALKAHRRELVDGTIAEHQGRIVKLTGDGMLVEFSSVVNAVACAVKIQRKMIERNADVPQDERIEFRIGVNLGDIIFEDNDIFGDGVNVAARIESIAKPGGVCVSSSVRDNVGNRLDLDFEDMGEQSLKNIDRPVRVYNVALGAAFPRPAKVVQAAAKDKSSIAVLPFTNMSGDSAQDYFCDGITEDIITELARYRSLSVIARNSSFQFRGPAVDLPAACRILGVRYIVEGSIRRAGSTVRITAQLIDGVTGTHVWAERFDRKIEDVFAVQDEVVHSIVSTLEGRLAAAGAAQVRAKPTSNWAAYDFFLQGRDCSVHYKIDEADALLARAIELDPNYAHAYAWRASTLTIKYWGDHSQETLRQAVMCAEKALSLDESDAWCHQAMGFVSLHSKKLTSAGMHFEKAMSINPNDVYVIADYANWLSYMGRIDEALRHLDLAMQHDPFPPSWMWECRGTTLILAKRYEEAISAFQKAPIENYFTHLLLASAYAWAGQLGNANREIALAREQNPDVTVTSFTAPYADDAHLDHIKEGFRMAGLPE
jgi:adenylate cyclase